MLRSVQASGYKRWVWKPTGFGWTRPKAIERLELQERSPTWKGILFTLQLSIIRPGRHGGANIKKMVQVPE